MNNQQRTFDYLSQGSERQFIGALGYLHACKDLGIVYDYWFHEHEKPMRVGVTFTDLTKVDLVETNLQRFYNFQRKGWGFFFSNKGN